MISDFELARMLFPKPADVVREAIGTTATTLYATADGDSSGGTVLVDFGNTTVSGDNSQIVEIPCSSAISEGDTVLVTLQGTTPVDAVSMGSGDRLAQDAQDIRDASLWLDSGGEDFSAGYEISYKALSPVGECAYDPALDPSVLDMFGDVVGNSDYGTADWFQEPQTVSIRPREYTDNDDLAARSVELDPIAVLDAADPVDVNNAFKHHLVASPFYEKGTPILYDEARFKSDGTYAVTRRYGYASLWQAEWEKAGNQAGDTFIRTPVDLEGIAKRCVFNLYPYTDKSSMLLAPWASPFELLYAVDGDGQGWLYRFYKPSNYPSTGNAEVDSQFPGIDDLAQYWDGCLEGAQSEYSTADPKFCIFYPLEVPRIETGTWDAAQVGSGYMEMSIPVGCCTASVAAYKPNPQGDRIALLDSIILEQQSADNVLTITVESNEGGTDTTQTYAYNGRQAVDVEINRLQSRQVIAAVNLVQ